MTSTYTNRLKIEKITAGEQANSWGDTTNSTFQNTFEEAISNVYEKALNGVSSPYSLTNGQGPVTEANNEMRQAAIRFSGHTTAFIIKQPQTSIGNGYERIYTIINDGTASGTIQMKMGDSGAVSDIIPPGGRAVLATNGINWYTIAGGGSTGGSGTRTITVATDNVFAGESIFVDTTSNVITLTLPQTPSVGSQIRFLDIADNFGSNALTLNPNGGKVFGSTANGTVSTGGAGFTLVYTGATYGWKITDE